MNKKLMMIVVICLSFYNILFAKSRNEVILDAYEYVNSTWVVRERNILDLYTYDGQGIVDDEPDGIDDRTQARYNDKTGKWEYSQYGNRLWWPFFVNDNVTGEAYAYGLKDTTSTFNTKIYSTEKWIAGKRAEDVNPSTAIYRGFAGIDCSGLVSRVYELPNPYYINVATLPTYALPVSIEDIRKGDLLLYFGTGEYNHVVIFGDERFDINFWTNLSTETNASIIHATPKDYVTGTHKRRVIREENVVFIRKGEFLYLYKEGQGRLKHFAYSLFPQYEWLSTTNTISVNIRSGTNIKLESILFELKDKDGNIISAGSDNKFLNISTANFKDVVEV